MTKITYKDSGVNYDFLDTFKIAAQKSAKRTVKNLSEKSNFKPLEGTRGESVFLFETPMGYVAHLEEGLGTKNLIADAVYKKTGENFYTNISVDTIATIVNDLIQLGALPLSLAMHLAVGNSEWFADKQRYEALINGWAKGCDLSSAIWTGGETPALQGIVESNTFLISGSAVGTIENKEHLQDDLQDNDVIILMESSGIHTNGLSLARKIAKNLDHGYQTKLPSGRTFGQVLLDASIIYVPILKDLQAAGIDISYSSHITGHGLRKIMRHKENFEYHIEKLLPVPEIFPFLAEQASLNEKEMYETFNMGVGYAFFVRPEIAKSVIEIAEKNDIKAVEAGFIKKSSTKKVFLKEHNIEFDHTALQIR